jgi:hypothetical protein
MKGKSLMGVVHKEEESVYWNPHFQRDNKQLVVNMRSTTAEWRRRVSETSQKMSRQQQSNKFVKLTKQDASCDISDRQVANREPSEPSGTILDRPSLEPHPIVTNPSFCLNDLESNQLITSFLQRLTPSCPSIAEVLLAEAVRKARMADEQNAIRTLGHILSLMQVMQPTLPTLGNSQLLQLFSAEPLGTGAWQASNRASKAPLTNEGLLLLLHHFANA